MYLTKQHEYERRMMEASQKHLLRIRGGHRFDIRYPDTTPGMSLKRICHNYHSTRIGQLGLGNRDHSLQRIIERNFTKVRDEMASQRQKLVHVQMGMETMWNGYPPKLEETMKKHLDTFLLTNQAKLLELEKRNTQLKQRTVELELEREVAKKEAALEHTMLKLNAVRSQLEELRRGKPSDNLPSPVTSSGSGNTSTGAESPEDGVDLMMAQESVSFPPPAVINPRPRPTTQPGQARRGNFDDIAATTAGEVELSPSVIRRYESVVTPEPDKPASASAEDTWYQTCLRNGQPYSEYIKNRTAGGNLFSPISDHAHFKDRLRPPLTPEPETRDSSPGKRVRWAETLATYNEPTPDPENPISEDLRNSDSLVGGRFFNLRYSIEKFASDLLSVRSYSELSEDPFASPANQMDGGAASSSFPDDMDYLGYSPSAKEWTQAIQPYRRQMIMAKIFAILFTRVLAPYSLRKPKHADLQHYIDQHDGHHRAITTEVTREIFITLSPLLYLLEETIVAKAKQRLLRICEKALQLRLTMDNNTNTSARTPDATPPYVRYSVGIPRGLTEAVSSCRRLVTSSRLEDRFDEPQHDLIRKVDESVSVHGYLDRNLFQVHKPCSTERLAEVTDVVCMPFGGLMRAVTKQPWGFGVGYVADEDEVVLEKAWVLRRS
ncbi:hypothetical protein B0H66DRAFT_395642 [Apodospora peruviana]|uniref:Uncharacterized protein n=1 Tax=Apodospora peruviana TaxID=516989 RepID=A0AAE0HSP1_9PEZI|nr:hypothetical protein B0H66DRAFT_395642 [Apodospora peruviana]